MNLWIQEVIDAHVIIERWLGRSEGSAQALMERFAAEFIMIPISGVKMDYQTVSGFFDSVGGSRPGLNIVIDHAQVLSEWPDGGAVLYRETQTLPEQGGTVRWSTAIFQRVEGKIIWRHLQETRIG